MMRKKLKITAEEVEEAKRKNKILQAQHKIGLFTYKIDKSNKQACDHFSLLNERALMSVRAKIEEVRKKQWNNFYLFSQRAQNPPSSSAGTRKCCKETLTHRWWRWLYLSQPHATHLSSQNSTQCHPPLSRLHRSTTSPCRGFNSSTIMLWMITQQ